MDTALTDALPYSFAKLDDLMEKAGIDVLLVTSKHNAQYLLGGYRFIFFSAMDAIGHSRYLPVIAYVKGAPDQTAYVANKMEGGEHANHPFWTPHFLPMSWGSVDSMTEAVRHLKDARPRLAPHRNRAVLPAVQQRQGAGSRLSERTPCRCDRASGTPARGQDPGGTRASEAGVRGDHRRDAGHHRRLWRG